jgi:hypothetical protein
MNNSKPGNKLDPALKAIIDPVYRYDRKRYAGLIRWVWHCQKQGWPDEVIGKAVKLARSSIHQVDDWWPYLSSLLPKASGRASEEESNNFKRIEFDFLSNLLGPEWTKRRDKQRRNSNE